jgi:hypothetical protein
MPNTTRQSLAITWWGCCSRDTPISIGFGYAAPTKNTAAANSGMSCLKFMPVIIARDGTRVAGSGEPSGVSHSHKTVKAITTVAPRASKALCSAHSTYWSSTAEFAPLDDQVPSAHSPSCSKAHISASPSMSVSRRTTRASFRRHVSLVARGSSQNGSAQPIAGAGRRIG